MGAPAAGWAGLDGAGVAGRAHCRLRGAGAAPWRTAKAVAGPHAWRKPFSSGGSNAAGVASALVFVFTSGWCLAQLARLDASAIPRGTKIGSVLISYDGLVIGEDPVLDAQRFHRTENGVVLVTRDMLAKL